MLINNQKHRNFKSNVWVEEEKSEKPWYAALTKLKPSEKATELSIRRRFPVYNVEQIDTSRLEQLPTPSRKMSESHTFITASGSFMLWKDKDQQQDLDAAKKRHKFTSNVWVPKSHIGKKDTPFANAKLADDAGPATTLHYYVPSRLLNADQFVDSDAIRMQPFSGAFGTPLPADAATTKILRADVNSRGFATGIYFTLKQLEAMSLTVAAGNTGVSAPFAPTDDKFTLYNLDEVVDGEAWARELQRFPIDEPTMLVKGTPLTGYARERAEASKVWKSNYYVRPYELKPNAKDKKKRELKRGAVGLYTGKDLDPLTFYNVEELENATLGYERVATYAKKA